MASRTKDFFETGSSNQFEWVLGLYDQCLRLKAENKSSKPENVIKLDKWYQHELPKKIKSRGKDAHLTHEEMVQTIKWKLARGKFRPNLVNLVQMNTPRVITQETKKAFRNLNKREDVQAAAAVLCNLKGVGPAMASAVLAAGAPHMAPFMADECLLAMPDVDSLDYTMKEYMSYVEHVKNCVSRLNSQGGDWTPHKVELAIWTHYVANDLKPELLSNLPSAAVSQPSESSNDIASDSAAAAPSNDEDSIDSVPSTSQEKESPTSNSVESGAAFDAVVGSTEPEEDESSSKEASNDAKVLTQEAEVVSANGQASPIEQPAADASHGQGENGNGHHETENASSVTTNGNGVAKKVEKPLPIPEKTVEPITNGNNAEKQENGTTKLSEAVESAEGTKRSSPSVEDEVPAAKKLRTEENADAAVA